MKNSQEIWKLWPFHGTKKSVEHEGGGHTKCSTCAWNGLSKDGARGMGDQRKNRYHPDDSMRDRTKYREESWRPEETCCLYDSGESQPANSAVNPQGIIIIIIIIIIMIIIIMII